MSEATDDLLSDNDRMHLGQLMHSLTNQPPLDSDVIVQFEAVRRDAKELGRTIIHECPPSRERSLAVTKLEEAVMWAIKSIAIHQED